jgi:hypothetical protein
MSDITDVAVIGGDETSFFPQINNRLLIPYAPVMKSVGIHSRHDVKVYPSRPIGEGDKEISFELPHVGESFCDLKNATVYIKGQLKVNDGTKVPTSAGALLVRHTYCALFEAVTVFVGKSFTECHTHTFPFASLINIFKENVNHQMSTAPLAGTSFESKSTSVNDYTTQVARLTVFQGSKDVELISNTHIPFFQTPGYVPPNTALRIKYRRSQPAFYTLVADAAADKGYRFDIETMYLRIPTVRIMPQINQHLSELRQSVNARLYFDNYIAKRYSIPADTQIRTFNSIFTGNLPKMLLMSLYKEDSFVGSNVTDPFFTSSEKLKTLFININGFTVKRFDIDMENKLYGSAYKSLVDGMGAFGKSFCISHKMWGMGNSYYVADFLNCETSGSVCTDELVIQGSLDIQVEFSEKTSDSQVLLVIAMGTDSMELLQDGNAVLNRVVV